IERWSIEEEVVEDYPFNVEITFYTSLACENGPYGAVDAQGSDLKFGTIAVPREYKLGTSFEFEGIDGIFYGTDRGSKKHIRTKEDGTIRVDMFIPRIKSESDSSYYKRVNNYGRYKTKGRMVDN
ncbi:MAG: hypothetical protein ACRDD8_06845, partial [Bacteroidales bacterium]